MQVLHKITISKLQNCKLQITNSQITILQFLIKIKKFTTWQYYIVTNCKIEICKCTFVNYKIINLNCKKSTL
jgi:hypothetical protein